ncbi:MAG: hypothetical protein ACRDDL_06705 [Sarcina sp.]
METVGKRSQTRMVKKKKNKRNRGLAWVNIGYIVILSLIIFGMGKVF